MSAGGALRSCGACSDACGEEGAHVRLHVVLPCMLMRPFSFPFASFSFPCALPAFLSFAAAALAPFSLASAGVASRSVGWGGLRVHE